MAAISWLADLPADVREFFALPELGDIPASRLRQVRRQLQSSGRYWQTTAELEIGARLAWRNHARCVGRSHWRTLTLFDRRAAYSAAQVANACREHLAWSTNGGQIRPAISVFAPDTPAGPRIRILNRQLIGFAGRAGTDGRMVGDPANLDLTELATRLGWRGDGGRFDVLPLLIEVDDLLSWHPVPPELVLRIPIRHPRLPALDALELQWYANPAVSDMVFSVGGIDYPAAPFSGWYVSSEVGARDLSDTYRYDALPAVAAALGLDTRHEWTLWRDHALVALTEAVSHSFHEAGVMVVDHHTVSRQFLAFLERERQAGRDLPTEWSWINPPMSASTTPTFHREYDPPAYQRRPNFYRRPAGYLADRVTGCQRAAAAGAMASARCENRMNAESALLHSMTAAANCPETGLSTAEEERNRQAVHRLIEAWNAGDVMTLASMWEAQMVHHGRESEPTSAADTAAEMQRFLAAFPDLKMELQSVIAEGDMVATRIQMHATHLGSFLDAEPTGRTVSCRLMGQLRFVDGRVVEHWGVADGLQLLAQIGLLPERFLAATA